ncbi:MAG: ABC transporter ATP-binding protein [Bacteroidales bacterium]|nr:ABC transporter ATP-binding protein [Bacteroidales bacterium]
MDRSKDKLVSVGSLIIGYGSKRLLPPLSAEALKGELVAVIGRNGIGKSTLLRTLLGLQPVLGGKVVIDGKNLKEMSRNQMARRIGYISTEIIRVSNMTVFDLVALGRYPYTNWIGQTDELSYAAVKDALKKTGLAGFESRYISSLSDGERQRTMIARILAQETDILIMDEPTAFLDIVSKFDIIKLMLSLASEGRTIIFSTHDLNIAVNQAHRIWMMLDEGITEGAPEDLGLDGSFDHLFKSGNIGFDKNDGTFLFRTEFSDSIYVEGEGPSYQWTRKALNRIGYSVNREPADPYIISPSAKNRQWILSVSGKQHYFNKLYDLVRVLSTGKHL